MTGPPIIDAQVAGDRLPFESLMDALAQGFATGCQLPERHHHRIERDGEPDVTLLLMPAWSHPQDPDQYIGVKIVTVVPGNAARNLPGLVSTYILYDAVTGQQLAIIDGNTITGRRTAATSALAAKILARPDAAKLLVIGSGRIASLLPYAYRAALPIEHVAVWDINHHRAEALAARLQLDGVPAAAVIDLAAAVHGADIVSAATLATQPLIKGDWLSPGTHIDLIGGFTPQMREADDPAILRAKVYVDTSDALHEAGDIVQPLRAGIISKDHIRGTLAQLIRYEREGRTSSAEVTYFKAVGSGLADMVAARMIYRG